MKKLEIFLQQLKAAEHFCHYFDFYTQLTVQYILQYNMYPNNCYYIKED